MSDRAGQFEWVNTIQRDIAVEALSILQGAIREFDLGRGGRLRLSGFAHDTPSPIGIGREEDWLRPRADVAAMLVSRGVLRWAESTYVGGPYVGDEDQGYWLFVEADENTARAAAAVLEQRFSPQPPLRRYDRTWVTDIDRRLLERLRPLMEEIKRRFDMDLEATSAAVSRTGPTPGGLRLPPGQTQRMIEDRQEELHVLQQRGVIRGWQARSSGPGFPEGFTVFADPRVVETTLATVEYLMSSQTTSQPATPHRSTSPASQQDLPEGAADHGQHPTSRSPADSLDVEVRRTHRIEQAKLPYAIVTPIVVAVALAILAFLFTPVGSWIKSHWFPGTKP